MIKNQMYAIIDVMIEYAALYKTNWSRSRESVCVEWIEHNRYAPFSDSAKHADFDNADEGRGKWYFFTKAISQFVD